MDAMGRMSQSPQEHAEGPVARFIEQQTAQLPSDLFLWAAGASIVGSLALQLLNRKEASLFVGQWAPTLLILGLYNKIVKVAGSDRTDAGWPGRSGEAGARGTQGAPAGRPAATAGAGGASQGTRSGA
jgi:hypothetical protein